MRLIGAAIAGSLGVLTGCGKVCYPAWALSPGLMLAAARWPGAGERDSATSSERRRRGSLNAGSAAPPALHNLGDPSPSPSGLG
jgi:hypothetical protein